MPVAAPTRTTGRTLTLHHQVEGGPVPDEIERRAGLRFTKREPKMPKGPRVIEHRRFSCSVCGASWPEHQAVVDHIQRVHPADA